MNLSNLEVGITAHYFTNDVKVLTSIFRSHKHFLSRLDEEHQTGIVCDLIYAKSVLKKDTDDLKKMEKELLQEQCDSPYFAIQYPNYAIGKYGFEFANIYYFCEHESKRRGVPVLVFSGDGGINYGTDLILAVDGHILTKGRRKTNNGEDCTPDFSVIEKSLDVKIPCKELDVLWRDSKIIEVADLLGGALKVQLNYHILGDFIATQCVEAQKKQHYSGATYTVKRAYKESK